MEALTGSDVITINGRILADLIDGDTVMVDFPNDIGAVKTGKNGNSIFAFNATGQNATTQIRLVLGSADDKFMQSLLASWIKDPSAFSLITAQFIKKTGDGAGNVASVIYDLTGGVFAKTPVAKTNVEGDTEQSVVVWNLTFSKGTRRVS